MKKILAIAMALVMVMALSVSVFADAIFTLDTQATDDAADLTAGYTISSWYPSMITQYMASDVAAAFVEAIQTEGAKIVITYTGDADVSVLLQSYPLDDGSSYTFATYSECEVVETADGKKQAIFDAAAVVAAYTSTPHGDDESVMCSLDKFLNFGVGGEGNTIYLIEVSTDVVTDNGNTGDDNTGDDNTGDDGNDTPANTGIALAVVPAVVAMAAVAVSKKH